MVVNIPNQGANQDRWQEVSRLLKSLYATVTRLEELFPGQKFTPDGHLVGSIGEVIAAYMFDLQLLPNSYQNHDAKTVDGKLVQIKLTQGKRGVAISGQPDYLIVLRMSADQSVEVVFNGRGAEPWNQAGKMQKNGQRSISLFRLRQLQANSDQRDFIQLRNEMNLHGQGGMP